MNLESAVARAKTTRTLFREKNVTFLAGSIAYSAFVSIVPLIMFSFLAVSVLGAPELQQRIVEVATDSVSPSVGGVIEVLIAQQSEAGTGSTLGASVVGVVVLVWGAIKVFRGLDTAFSEVYETTARESVLGQIRKSLVILVVLTVGVVAMVGATGVVAFLSFLPFVGIVTRLLLVVALVLAFFPMYYLFPDVAHGPRDALPGAVVAAVGWTVLQVLFQVYVTLSGSGGNLIADVLLFVTWLYFTGVVLLLGATVNAVLVGRGDEIVEGRSGAADGART
jgi:membrane protein